MKNEIKFAEDMIAGLANDQSRYEACGMEDQRVWAAQELGWWERRLKSLKDK
ncbi:hypothetical protein OG357_23015 [Streptomyces sp. NBC_01255]|uniref:hypothetical protein n=1 Tax=Streptomyces sp. NBC_01255 TaxID=2903798 RepID=UPI002E3546A9|nr:hypothetical protein [Streptomyces sp. NBC_01255]